MGTSGCSPVAGIAVFPSPFGVMKDGVSKIALACELLGLLPDFEHLAYLLMDSWYTSMKTIDNASAKGLQVIGGLKTHRVLFPLGVRTPASTFAGYIRKADTRLVTVGHASYRVYRYEAALHGMANAVVLLTWPEEMFGKHQALRCTLCTDVSLQEEEVLMRYVKSKYAWDRYRVRSVRAIERLWTLLF